MEAFEKQLKEWHKKGLPLSPGDCLHNTHAGLQVGWRAALEWAQEQGSVNNYREIADELEDK